MEENELLLGCIKKKGKKEAAFNYFLLKKRTKTK